MATSAKAGSNGRHKGANGTQSRSSRIFDDVLALAGTLARGRKEFGANQLQSLANATREFAAAMTELPNLRGHVASAAESIEGLAEYVMETEIEQMVADAGTFARRHPLATVAMAAVAGMAAIRFMRPWPASGNARSGRASQARSRTGSKSRRQPAQLRRSASGRARANA